MTPLIRYALTLGAPFGCGLVLVSFSAGTAEPGEVARGEKPFAVLAHQQMQLPSSAIDDEADKVPGVSWSDVLF